MGITISYHRGSLAEALKESRYLQLAQEMDWDNLYDGHRTVIKSDKNNDAVSWTTIGRSDDSRYDLLPHNGLGPAIRRRTGTYSFYYCGEPLSFDQWVEKVDWEKYPDKRISGLASFLMLTSPKSKD